MIDQPSNSLGKTTEDALSIGLKLHRLGDLAGARACYQTILENDPLHLNALQCAATLEFQYGNREAALELFVRASNLASENPTIINNLGVTLRSLDRLDEAVDSFTKAITINRDYLDAYWNLGDALYQVNRLEDAINAYAEILRINPDTGTAAYIIGNLHAELGRYEQAISSYDAAIRANPDFADAHNNKGNALSQLKKYEASLTSYDDAIRLKPDFAAALSNRGIALAELGRFEDAIADYDAAIQISPDYAQAFNNKGCALENLKRYDEALVNFKRAISFQPKYPYLYGKIALALSSKCEWTELGATIENIRDGVMRSEPVTTPFALIAVSDDPQLQKKAAEIWVRDNIRPSKILGQIHARPRRERIHVGYLSADFHEHATSYLTAELFEVHDKSRFEITGISFGPATASPMRSRVSAAMDHFVDVRALSDLEVAKLCRDIGVDIAIDLKGYTFDSRPGILAERCAPIQINWLGYPGTMAAPFIDYLIADETLITEADVDFYTEKIIWLPDSYQVNDGKRAIGTSRKDRRSFGLPESGVVFCCFNSSYKITGEIFGSWMAILVEVPDSVLWLLEDNPTATSNLRNEAAARGVAPHRLVFASRLSPPAHLARHELADLFLDTWPCNAHTTASDALWAGLPILTLAGKTFASRVAASLLNAVGLPELITGSFDQYEKLAIRLAKTPGALPELKSKLLRNRAMHPLFDCRRFTRHLEAAYSEIMTRYWNSVQPENFLVHVTQTIDPWRTSPR